MGWGQADGHIRIHLCALTRVRACVWGGQGHGEPAATAHTRDAEMHRRVAGLWAPGCLALQGHPAPRPPHRPTPRLQAPAPAGRCLTRAPPRCRRGLMRKWCHVKMETGGWGLGAVSKDGGGRGEAGAGARPGCVGQAGSARGHGHGSSAAKPGDKRPPTHTRTIPHPHLHPPAAGCLRVFCLALNTLCPRAASTGTTSAEVASACLHLHNDATSAHAGQARRVCVHAWTVSARAQPLPYTA